MTYQIPPEVAHFVDREHEEAAALRAAAEWTEEFRPLCLALYGLSGAGKTELAFRVARTLRDRGAEEIVYVDLDDARRGGAVEVADVLGELLRALRVDREEWGHTLSARHKMYWERTQGARLVVVVDNARFGSEVLPLFPASGDSVVIVTSHGLLHDLEEAAALALPLDPLSEGDSRELLRRLTDERRLAAEPEAAAGLLSLCSGLPVALRAAGRWARGHRRRSLERLLGELTAEFRERGLPETEPVWEALYRELHADAALLYRLLAAAPGPSFTAESATALLGRGQHAAEDALEDLEAAGLLVTRRLRDTGGETGAGMGSETGAQRTLLPELVRAHARRCADEHGARGQAGPTAAESELGEAQRRLVRWYLRQAQRADACAAGPRLTVAERQPALPEAPDVRFNDAAHAYRWLEAERHALYGCVELAAAHGLDEVAFALCEPLWTHFLDHPHHADALDAFARGLAAAERAEHVRAMVRMGCQLARPLWEQQRYEEAAYRMERALSAAELLGSGPEGYERDERYEEDRKLAASAVEFRGMLHSAQGEWTAAAADFAASRDVHEAIDNTYGVMLQTYRLGEATAALGRLDRAADLLHEAHASARRLERERMTARTGFALGGVLQRLGRTEEARELYDAALASARRRGSAHDEKRVRKALNSLNEQDEPDDLNEPDEPGA